jgi:hypothetical protein
VIPSLPCCLPPCPLTLLVPAQIKHAHTRMPGTLKNVEASGDFKVADMSLADFGRKELDLAEHEMPGLMSSRTEFGPSQPLAGAPAAVTRHRFPPRRLMTPLPSAVNSQRSAAF